jgi:transcriptional regulator with XRE-family HTH domain
MVADDLHLADKVGQTDGFISYLENASRTGSLETYDKIASALGVSTGFLFSDQPANKKTEDANKTLSLDGLSPSQTRTLRNLVRDFRRSNRK